MAFLQKTWKDRVAEYINRRVLTKEDGTTELVSVERSEGTISQEGDAFSAANMNDLEQRIANEFSEQNKNLADITDGYKIKIIKKSVSFNGGLASVDIGMTNYSDINIFCTNTGETTIVKVRGIVDSTVNLVSLKYDGTYPSYSDTITFLILYK